MSMPAHHDWLSGHPAALALVNRHRLRVWEPLPWILALAFYFAFPNYLGFGTDLLVTILFALSLDLALGYAGIVTLGHAAFFGAGAYTVGMLAHHGIWNEPISSLMIAAGVAALIGLASGLILLRTTGLTLLMLTLCTMALLEEAANMGEKYTGGFDGLPNLPIPPLFGLFEFNPLYPRVQYMYVLGVLFVCFVFIRTLVYSPFGQSLTGIRENVLRMHAVGAPVNWRLVTCYTISAAIAGIAGGLWAQANAYVNLSTLGLDRAATVLIILVLGGYGRLYGAFIGAVVYMALSHFLAKVYPTAWQLGLGLLLMLIALFARNGVLGLWDQLTSALHAQARAVMTETLLETRSLAKSFGALAAARDINFRLEAGARHALIGPNGAGKTTFINLLTGVFLPTQGQVLLRGRDITTMEQSARVKLGIARTFQINRLFRGLSVLENVYIAVAERLGAGNQMMKPAGMRKDIVDEAMRLLDMLKLSNDAGHRISELPYGRQRLVELAIALGLEPEVLLLDEPAAGVPSAESHIILDAVAALPKHIGVLIIDHDMDLVFRFAQRITVLVGGAIFAEGTPKEIGADQRVRDVYLGQAHHG